MGIVGSSAVMSVAQSLNDDFAPWKKGICPFAFWIKKILSNGNSSEFRDDVITNPHFWGQDLQGMNMRYLQKCCNVA